MISSNVMITIISAIVSATVSEAINRVDNLLRDKREVKRKIMEKRLEKIYDPIIIYMETKIECVVYDNEYYGMKEDEVEHVIEIIENNRYIANEEIIKMMENFKEEVYISQHYIRPENTDYAQLYDRDRKFLDFIQKQANEMREYLLG